MNNPAPIQPTIARQRARIQLISFIAILFSLFATFAMFALTREKKSSMALDQAGCGGCFGGESEPAVVLQVTDVGLFWNKELITQKELAVALAKYGARSKNPTIVLAGDDHTKYGQLVATFDEIRKAGIKQVTVESIHRGTGE